MTTNRRKHIRVDLSDTPLACDVRIIDTDGEFIPLPPETQPFIMNVSGGGAEFCLAGVNLPDMPHIHCILRFALQGRSFALKGEIRWKQSEPSANGVQYGGEWSAGLSHYGVAWMSLSATERSSLQASLLKEYEQRLQRKLYAKHLGITKEE